MIDVIVRSVYAAVTGSPALEGFFAQVDAVSLAAWLSRGPGGARQRMLGDLLEQPVDYVIVQKVGDGEAID